MRNSIFGYRFSSRRQPDTRFWQPLPDAGGKVASVAGGFRSFGDVAVCSKVCEWQIRVDLTAFIEELIDVAIGE